MSKYANFSEQTCEAIDALLAYRNEWVVNRFAVEKDVSHDYAERVFSSFKQFMATCVLTDGPKTTSPVIDDMWHVFLLNTKQYSAFCNEYLRGFVHHEPSEEGTDPALYIRTRLFAEHLFGQLDDKCWPTKGKASCSSGCGTIKQRFD